MSWYRLFVEMGPALFKKFAGEHVSLAIVRPGSLLWIPFGWHAACLSEVPAVDLADDNQNVLVTLVLPVLSAELAKACDCFGDIASHVETEPLREPLPCHAGPSRAGCTPGSAQAARWRRNPSRLGC